MPTPPLFRTAAYSFITAAILLAGCSTAPLQPQETPAGLPPVSVRTTEPVPPAAATGNTLATLEATPAGTQAGNAARQGQPEITLDGYWSYMQGVNNTASAPVPLLLHVSGINTGDAAARDVTASVRLYYQNREICWKSIRLGTLGAGGHTATDTMIFCPLPSGLNSGEMVLRFENIAISE